ncbi:MAG: hypothetical protein S4CHLAM20_15610 [Chlamydiia bacterium]|nr:hypothetical protein [Chlamydiia bacterium]
MKKILILLFIASSLFSIYVENYNNLQKHIDLAWHHDFDSVGYIKNKFGEYATGTLIHPNIAITAAHLFCHTQKAIFNIKINGKHIKVKGRSICHPQFTFPNKKGLKVNQCLYDIALFILEEPIDLPSFPKIEEKLLNLEDQFHAVGYGKWKRICSLSLMNKKIAGKTFVIKRDKKFVLAETENSKNIDMFVTAKKGDSGSPLLSFEQNPTILGVLTGNYNSKKLQKNYKLYLNPYFHIDWIKKTIEENTV